MHLESSSSKPSSGGFAHVEWLHLSQHCLLHGVLSETAKSDEQLDVLARCCCQTPKFPSKCECGMTPPSTACANLVSVVRSDWGLLIEAGMKWHDACRPESGDFPCEPMTRTCL